MTSTPFLDRAHDLLTGDEIEAGLALLHSELDARRREGGEWNSWVEQNCRPHPLFDLLQADPMTRHSVSKPRGYAGDAQLMDFPYGLHPDLAGETELGRAIFAENFRHPVCRSVRERKTGAAHKLDAIAREQAWPQVASIACGHLREALECSALRENGIGRLSAFDQDARSLEVVQSYDLAPQIRPVQGSIRALLAGKTCFSECDLIYSLGLYDYLVQPVAERLTARLFGMLRSGGSLWLANFARDHQGAGYMEAFMDWWLIGRDEAQVLSFAREIEPGLIRDCVLHADEDKNVLYLELSKE